MGDVALQKFLQDFSRERTFDNLSSGLGEDKARAVITSIGEAALSAAPELNGGGLGSVVVQTLARLSQQDLAGIARNESSAVGRAQAIIQEEVKAQKNAQAPVNQHGAGLADGQLRADGVGRLGGALPAALSGRSDYNRALQGSASEKAGLTSTEIAGLEKMYGRDTVSLAMRQVQDMGLSGKQNVAYAAEFKDVAAALHGGDIAQARALAAAEKDPAKKARIEAFIKNYVDAARGKLDAAAQGLPREEAEKIKKTFEAYQRDPNNPERKQEYEALKDQHKNDKAIMKALGSAEKDAEKISGVKAKLQTKNAVKGEALAEDQSNNNDALAGLNDDPAPSTTTKAASVAPPSKHQPAKIAATKAAPKPS